MFTEIIIVSFEKHKYTLEKSAKLFNVKVDRECSNYRGSKGQEINNTLEDYEQ
jgi:hypothetical protein